MSDSAANGGGSPVTDEAMRASLAAIVPCYNAGERLRPVVERLVERLDHVLVVDDGSTDGSPDTVADLPAQVIVMPENQGKGFAMMNGFRAALDVPGVDCIAIVDADGQHDPAELPGLYAALVEQDAAMVIGARTFELAHVPWRNRLGNKLTAFITTTLLKQRVPDTQSGYRLHSRAFVEYILENVPGGRYETEMEILVKGVLDGFKVVSAPIQTIYEEGNPSSHFNKLKDSYRIYARLFRVALRARRK